MLQADVDFLTANIIHFETVKLGYTKNIPHAVLAEYEAVYRRNLDPQFILTYWCGACVFDMLSRLMFHYENYLKSIEPKKKKK